MTNESFVGRLYAELNEAFEEALRTQKEAQEKLESLHGEIYKLDNGWTGAKPGSAEYFKIVREFYGPTARRPTRRGPVPDLQIIVKPGITPAAVKKGLKATLNFIEQHNSLPTNIRMRPDRGAPSTN